MLATFVRDCGEPEEMATIKNIFAKNVQYNIIVI